MLEREMRLLCSEFSNKLHILSRAFLAIVKVSENTS